MRMLPFTANAESLKDEVVYISPASGGDPVALNIL